MDWLKRMNSALEYIESNLAGKIDYDQAARIACCSTYHLQRMFPFITNVPLSEYIRRRRLTFAAFELQNSGVKVIDVALKYGYESPEAFSRAFKKMHGVMPMSVRDRGVPLKAYPRMSFDISIRGAVEMNYRIEEKQGFEMFGVTNEITAGGENPFIEIPQFWKNCINDGTIDRIRAAAGLEEDGEIHSVLFNNNGEKFTYLIGYFLPESGIPHGYKQIRISPQTYAIFTTGLNPQNDIHDIWRRISSEWFPTSDYEYANGPEFEMSYNRGNGMYEMEVWIPVVKRVESI
ncbi:AraC family transcriptional regulator [Paenibacillus pinisoli]|uniref:AraC family transcriptional regulator n=1 Tax=Paenibacillus pinisoli TaxID=1276110 RepID=A0A3A6PQ12_9BACL|nr:AraC family transcriptional regulator [Paenibacillus pinisoli]RJX41766.1 AraC family transcriptional regulator [Paenibacillus pinisoli]